MSLALAPAWTKEIDGKVYAVKRIGGNVYQVWRAGKNVGSFEFFPHTAHGPTAYARNGPEARALADAFVAAYRNEVGL